MCSYIAGLLVSYCVVQPYFICFVDLDTRKAYLGCVHGLLNVLLVKDVYSIAADQATNDNEQLKRFQNITKWLLTLDDRYSAAVALSYNVPVHVQLKHLSASFEQCIGISCMVWFVLMFAGVVFGTIAL